MWRLELVSISNFKSIVEENINTTQGLNVIFGKNGSGKSCFLEAIVFALGGKLTDMRVNSLSELSHQRVDISTEVRLTWKCKTEVLIIGSAVKERKRVFFVGNTKMPMNKFTEFVRQKLNIPPNFSLWYISQRSATNIFAFSSRSLYDSVVYASGTWEYMESKVMIQATMKQCSDSMHEVLMSLESLRNEIAVKQQLQDSHSNIKQKEGMVKYFEELFERNSSYYESIEKAFLLWECHTSYQKLLSNFECFKCSLISLSKFEEDIEMSGLVENIKIHEDRHANAEQRLSLVLRDKRLLEHSIATITQQMEIINSDIVSAENEREYIEKCTLPDILNKLENIRVAEIDPQTFCHQIQENIAKEREHIASFDNEIGSNGQTLVLLQETLLKHETESKSLQKNLEQLQSQINELTQNYEDVVSRLERGLLPSPKDITGVNSIIELVEIEENITNEISMMRSELVELCNRKRSLMNSVGLAPIMSNQTGDFGYLLDSLTINKTNISQVIDQLTAKGLKTALNSILRRNSRIRLTDTLKTSLVVLSALDREGIGSIRIWAVEKISAEKVQVDYSMHNDDSVFDPLHFISLQNAELKLKHDSILSRIFRGVAIIRDHCDAQMVFTTFPSIRSCVTFDGDWHNRDSITLENQEGSTAVIDYIMQNQQFATDIAAFEVDICSKSATLESIAKLIKTAESHAQCRHDWSRFDENLELTRSKCETLKLKINHLSNSIQSQTRTKQMHIDNLNRLQEQFDQFSCQVTQKGNIATLFMQEKERLKERLVTLICAMENYSNQLFTLQDQLESLKELMQEKSTAAIQAYQDEETSLRNVKLLRIEYTTRTESKLSSQSDADREKITIQSTVDTIISELNNIIRYKKSEATVYSDELDWYEDVLEKVMDYSNMKVSFIETCMEKSREAIQRCYDLVKSLMAISRSLTTEEITTYIAGEKAKLENVVVANRVTLKMSWEELNSMRSEAKDMKSKYKNCNQASINADCDRLSMLESKFNITQEALRSMERSLSLVDTAAVSRLQQNFVTIRVIFQKFFSELVPGYLVDLQPVDCHQLEHGLEFALVDSLNPAPSYATRSESFRDVRQLSGGQKALLGISFLFALASRKVSPIYIFDEIDAALDIANQSLAAKLVAQVFSSSQILCVSHHDDFLKHSKNRFRVENVDGVSKIKKV